MISSKPLFSLHQFFQLCKCCLFCKGVARPFDLARWCFYFTLRNQKVGFGCLRSQGNHFVALIFFFCLQRKRKSYSRSLIIKSFQFQRLFAFSIFCFQFFSCYNLFIFDYYCTFVILYNTMLQILSK